MCMCMCVHACVRVREISETFEVEYCDHMIITATFYSLGSRFRSVTW